MDFRVTFWGVRGTFPCPSATHLGYGGNTSCVEVQVGGQVLVLDAGTGLRSLGKRFLKDGVKQATLLLTHAHWDHVNGFPFFEPAYTPDFSMTIHACGLKGARCIGEVMSACMETPLFPVPIQTMQAKLGFENFCPGEVKELAPGVTVRTQPLNHPGGAVGYRIEHAGKSFCYVTDTEHVPGTLDENVLRLIEGADMVVYDSSYTEEEFARRIGWGHSTWNQGVRLCQEAGAKSFCLFHHDPDHDDAAMAAMEREARRVMPTAFAARERMTLNLLDVQTIAAE